MKQKYSVLSSRQKLLTEYLFLATHGGADLLSQLWEAGTEGFLQIRSQLGLQKLPPTDKPGLRGTILSQKAQERLGGRNSVTSVEYLARMQEDQSPAL